MDEINKWIDLFSKKEHITQDDVVRSYLSTLSIDEISDLFFSTLDEKEIKKLVRIELQKRLVKKSEGILKIVDQVINILKENTPVNNKIRGFIGSAYESLPDKQQELAFFATILNKRSNDRKLAVNIARMNFKEKYIEKLKDCIRFHNSYQAFLCLDENQFLDFHLDYKILKGLYNYKSTPEWAKRRILLFFSRHDFEEVQFLKEENPITFLYMSAKNNILIEEPDLNKAIKQLGPMNFHNFSLITWCLARNNQKDLLIKLYENAENLENIILSNKTGYNNAHTSTQP